MCLDIVPRISFMNEKINENWNESYSEMKIT